MNAEHPSVDLRLVPAALTSWVVTAAGIVWSVGALAAVVVGAIAVAAAVRWWSARGRDRPVFGTAGVLTVALIALAFAVSVGLRAHEVRQHPITARTGSTVAVTVTPSESPRVVAGSRLMFRAALHDMAGAPAGGSVTVFAPGWGFGEVTAGRPTSFRARIGRPIRADLTVAVLTAVGEPTVGRAPAAQRLAGTIRAAFAAVARLALPADQAAMLPGLVLGDTSTVTATTTAEFKTAGLTHLRVP